MFGKPVIKGMRITVELVLRMLSEGASVEDILIGYPPLKPIHISTVLEYAGE